jgi:hypothetical protein
MESLKNGTLDLSDIAVMHEVLSVKCENRLIAQSEIK